MVVSSLQDICANKPSGVRQKTMLQEERGHYETN